MEISPTRTTPAGSLAWEVILPLLAGVVLALSARFMSLDEESEAYGTLLVPLAMATGVVVYWAARLRRRRSATLVVAAVALPVTSVVAWWADRGFLYSGTMWEVGAIVRAISPLYLILHFVSLVILIHGVACAEARGRAYAVMIVVLANVLYDVVLVVGWSGYVKRHGDMSGGVFLLLPPYLLILLVVSSLAARAALRRGSAS